MLTTGTRIAYRPNPELRATGEVLIHAGEWLLVRLDTPPNQVAPCQHPFIVAADAVEILGEPA